MKKTFLLLLFVFIIKFAFCWGFYAHQKINYYAVFLLPPQMMVFYKQNLSFISEHSTDPDKRRYAVAEEGPRHYLDIDRYGHYPYDSLPHNWDSAVQKFGEDTLRAYGIVPWWIQTMKARLTTAFKEKSAPKILKLSAEIGHYIADAHVPLHACSNHNGQFTDQKGIHGFWESRLPELLADKEWNFFTGKTEYIANTQSFIWKRLLQSAAAADTVLKIEKALSLSFAPDQRFAFENKNGVVQKQYSAAYARAYNDSLHGMVERRMRQSIEAVAAFWYTAWVDAGQPDLTNLTSKTFTIEELAEFDALNRAWRTHEMKGRPEEWEREKWNVKRETFLARPQTVGSPFAEHRKL